MKNTTVSRRCASGILAHRLQILALTLRLGSNPVCAANLDQAGSRNDLQEVSVRQSFFQMPSCDPNMFTGDALRAPSLPVFDGIDDGTMMFFRDGANFLPPGYGVTQNDMSVRCNKREPVNLINGSPQRLVFSDVKDGFMKNFV